ncbi:MAG: DUF5615 family PIN-like protein [Bacteroidetes bacterium]|nr:DUF5615 family PIN-like protein [Bacteroidota bacterium]
MVYIRIISSIPDDEVLKIAYEDERVLITTDKDFGELVFRLRLPTRGVLLLRIPELSHEEKSNLLQSVIPRIYAELSGAFTVITKEKIRIVPLNA